MQIPTCLLNLRKLINLSSFFSTKSEKGPQSIGSDRSDNSSNKTASEQEKARQKSEASNSLSQSSSSGCTAGEVCHRKSFIFRFCVEERPDCALTVDICVL